MRLVERVEDGAAGRDGAAGAEAVGRAGGGGGAGELWLDAGQARSTRGSSADRPSPALLQEALFTRVTVRFR
ncbi:hypothetical protein ACIA8O_31640 [Kitasatospora sp. NPDC051853]|uniref:hypothetical protein n=1 Tax=Kitasatospora sp. NPDC051853 TaxID=3364058 RepID=UPI003787F818